MKRSSFILNKNIKHRILHLKARCWRWGCGVHSFIIEKFIGFEGKTHKIFNQVDCYHAYMIFWLFKIACINALTSSKLIYELLLLVYPNPK